MFGLALKASVPAVKPQLVQQTWIDRALNKTKYTPDIASLQMKKEVFVFVYNELMSDHSPHHKFFGDSPFQGKGYTLDSYSMWKKNLGNESFPIALKGLTQGPGQTRISSRKLRDINPAYTSDVKLGHIKGEVYKVTPDQVIQLDERSENTVQFNRVQTQIVIPHYVCDVVGDKIIPKATTFIRHAYMYLGNLNYWHDLLDNGVFYSVVKQRETNPVFPAFNNSFYYSVKEHNEFQGRLTYRLPRV